MEAPAFQLYAADFYMDTVAWNVWEVGAYMRLLLYEWINGGVPNNIEEIARIIGEAVPDKKKRYNVKRERFLCDFDVKIRRNVLQKFHKNSANFLINHRLEQTRKEQEERREQQQKAGLKGIDAKKKKGIFPFNKPSDPLSDPLSDPSSKSQALQSSSSKIKKTARARALQNPFQKPDDPRSNWTTNPTCELCGKVQAHSKNKDGKWVCLKCSVKEE